MDPVTDDVREVPAPAGNELFAALGSRAFAAVWGGQSISRLGNRIGLLVIPWAVYQLTGSSADMGLVAAAYSLPLTVFVLAGGVVGDRFPRWAVICIADVAAGVSFAGLGAAAMTGHLSIPVLAANSVIQGVASALFTPAFGPLLKSLVGRDCLQSANALDSLSSSGTAIVGPAVGGLLYTGLGTAGAFLVDAATFAVAVLGTLFARSLEQAARTGSASPGHPARVPMWREALAGLGYVRDNGWLVGVIAISAAANLLVLAPYEVLLPAVVRQLHAGVDLLATSFAVQAVASLLATTLLGRVRVRRRAVLLFLGAGSAAVGTGLLGTLPGAATVCVSSALVGAGTAAFFLEHVLIQELVPDELMSRVYGLDAVGSLCLYPVGAVLAGTTAQVVGAGVVLPALSVCCLLTAVAVWSRAPHLRRL